LIIGKR